MKMWVGTFLIAVFSIGAISATDLGTVEEEREKLLQVVRCDKKKVIAGDSYYGELWQCLNKGEDSRLWINSYKSMPNEIKSIKVSVVKKHGVPMPSRGQSLISSVSELYGGEKNIEIIDDFLTCPIDKSYKIGEIRFDFDCSKGPHAV